MKKSNRYSHDNPFYEHLADDPFYLFLSKESFLFDKPHYHESLEIIYLIRGKTTVYLSGFTRDLEEGDIFICNKKLMHFYKNYDPDTLALCVVLSNKYSHDLREQRADLSTTANVVRLQGQDVFGGLRLYQFAF